MESLFPHQGSNPGLLHCRQILYQLSHKGSPDREGLCLTPMQKNYICLQFKYVIPKTIFWRRQWHPTPVLLPGKPHGWRSLVGCSLGGHEESGTTERLHFHALEKEMATHSSVLAWRIPGTGEPGGLPSMGMHRVGHD